MLILGPLKIKLKGWSWSDLIKDRAEQKFSFTCQIVTKVTNYSLGKVAAGIERQT